MYICYVYVHICMYHIYVFVYVLCVPIIVDFVTNNYVYGKQMTTQEIIISVIIRVFSCERHPIIRICAPIIVLPGCRSQKKNSKIQVNMATIDHVNTADNNRGLINCEMSLSTHNTNLPQYIYIYIYIR